MHACAWMCLCAVRVHGSVYVWDACAWVCMCGVRVHECMQVWVGVWGCVCVGVCGGVLGIPSVFYQPDAGRDWVLTS